MSCNFNDHCTKVPIPQKCLDYCAERILRNANTEEKQLVLGLGESLAHKIFRIYNSISVNSFNNLERNLTKDEIDALRRTFIGITQSRLSFFQKSQFERESIVEQIKRGNLDLDNLDDLIAN